MSATVRERRATVHHALILGVLGFVLLGCEPSQEEEHESEQPAERQPVDVGTDTDAWEVAPRANADGEARFEEDRSRHADFSDAMHAVFAVAARARDSEMGHEAYRPEMHEDFMAERARLWLELVRVTQSRFADGIAARPEALRSDDGGWEARGEPLLADLPWGVYVYHMHHRNEWFAHHGLEDPITHNALGYLTGLSRHVFEGFYDDGRFYRDPDHEEFDLASLAAGQAAAHAMAYAWVRHAKPGGEEDMGQVPEEQLSGWLGKDPEGLLDFARESADVLEAAWDSDHGVYRFDGMQSLDLDVLGQLLRGHKALYEVLTIFGDEEDQGLAEELFDRAAQMARAVLELEQDWGLPARLRFDEGGVAPDAEVVNTTAQWEFIAHLSAGFSFLREREGTAMMLERRDPELAEKLDAMVDRQIQAALEYQMPEGILVRELDFGDGAVRDADHELAGITRFLLGAGEGYGGSGAFATPGDWDEADEQVRERTKALYQSILDHGEFVEERLIRRPEGKPAD